MSAQYVAGRGWTAWDHNLGCGVTWDGGQWVPDSASASTAYRPTSASSTVVNLHGVIGEGQCTAEHVRAQLARAGRQPVVVDINSGGGCLREGVAITGALAGHKPGVTARIRRADSVASLIAQAAGRRVMLPMATIGIHLPYSTFDPDTRLGAADLLRAGASLERDTERIAKLYAHRTGLSAATWQARMRSEQRYGAHAAVSVGLADEVAA